MKVHAKNQGGSLTSFVIVGVVLAVLLVGGLYAVQRYKTNMETSKEVATNSENSKSNDEKNTSDSSDNETKKSSDTSSNSSSSNTSTDKDDKKTTNSTTLSSSDTSNLPNTGPEDTLPQVIAVAALVFAGVSYFRSRQASLDF